MASAVAPTITIQIPQLAITDVDSSRPQTLVSMPDIESVPTSPTTKRMDSLKVGDIPRGWRRKRSSSISTMETLPTYSGPGSPTRQLGSRNRSNSMTPSVHSEAPSYRTIPEDHDSTVYHLYRIGGPKGGNMSIHEVADKSLGALPRATFADGSQRPTPGWWSRTCGAVNSRTARRPDHPKFDPRMAAYYVHKPTLPVGWKPLPYTLRVGPNRHSPISCRFDGSFAWRKWDFDFEDINGEGIVDERGVIAEEYPRKIRKPGWKKASDIGKDTEEDLQDEAEMLKEKTLASPRTKSPCLCSSIIKAVTKKMGERESRKKTETNNLKSTPEQQKEIIAPAPVRPVPAINIAGDPLTDTEKEALAPKEETPATGPKPLSTARNLPALTIDTSKASELTPPPTPSTPNHPDKVQMIWENKLGRQYSFTYRNIKFSWKGTSTLKDEHNKKWGALNRYSHLKLVAELPGQTEETPVTPVTPKSPRSPCLSPDDAEKPGFLLRRRSSISSISSIFSKKSTTKAPKKELVVATYTSTWGKRKAGRLHIDNTAIEKLVQIIADASPVPFSPLPRRRSTSFSGDHYLSPDSFSPPTKKRHAHVFPTPKLPDSPIPVDVFERKRLRELTVVSCVAMANGEQEKRHAIIEMTALLAEIAQNVATG
ncbi:hypothetical protein TWF506_004901 [Arthrobotrys conoides]|uniref:Uncharacterized protein n=1 Tax=Arthrobotrys conoides TaxID=74498 RepID=A0AAN8NIE2_9PEZI